MADPRYLFHRGHYNILANQLSIVMGDYTPANKTGGPGFKAKDQACFYALTRLALNMAKRLQQDNPNFDPLKFLDACSPNTDLYPLSELWEDYIAHN